MNDDLRARLAAAFEPHCWHEFASTGEVVTSIQVADALDAVVPVVEDAIRRATLTDCCGQVLHGPHTMACPKYVGPVDHWKSRDPDGDVSCTCGWPRPAFGEECHNTAETWRGPMSHEGP